MTGRFSKPDLRTHQQAVAGIAIQRQVGRHDVALQLHDDRDVFADLEALRDAEPPASVETPAGRQTDRVDAARIRRGIVDIAAADEEGRLPWKVQKPGRICVTEAIGGGGGIGLVGKEPEPGVLVEKVEFETQLRRHGLEGYRLANEERDELVAAVEAARQRAIDGVAEVLLAEFEYRFEMNILPHASSRLAAGAKGVEILVAPQADVIRDQVRLDRCMVHPGQGVRK